jgi:hypothetical protein
MPILSRERQEDLKFKASRGYIARPCLLTKKQKKNTLILHMRKPKSEVK